MTLVTGGLKAGTQATPAGLHDLVLWNLGCEIVSGQLPAGELLPFDVELIKRYSVSRTVIREVLKTLKAKGMVAAKPSVGTRVLASEYWNMFDKDVLAWHVAVGPTAEFLKQVMEIRLTIESDAAALAALRRTDQQALAILGWAERMAASERDGAQFARYDLEFHRAIAEASSNAFMRSITATVEVALTAIFTMASPIADGKAFDETVQIHREIARAIESRNPEAADTAMRKAISSGYDRATSKVSKK
jgi:DNA-binding FadR family transcriptional regulator